MNLHVFKLRTVLLTLMVIGGMMLQGCPDPRKNCNHPKHSEYVKEKMEKKQKMK